MNRSEFKQRMQSLKSYREQNPGKGYWDWRAELENTEDIPEYKDGGIHIKPENRGKFTALKKRTGKSASWFKEHGTPSQKKMATFALNAKKWKHADGGEIPPDNSPVHVNPITNRPLANGAIQPIFNLEDAASLTPAGDILTIRDMYTAAQNRDMLGLGLASLGFIPFVRGLGRRTINRPVPTVDRSYLDRQYEQMERERARRLQAVDDYYNQSDAVYESLIENEEAFRRAVNADATANTDYVKTYTDMLRGYRGSTSRNNDALPQMRLTDNIPYDAKAQVDPSNLDWIRINRRYSDPNELDPTFQRMNPGLVRHELGHIVDERSGLNYTNTLSDPSKFESEERLKEMYPKTYKRLQNEVLNRGSEIKSYMNEFRDYLIDKEGLTGKETLNSFKKKLDTYGEEFPVLRKIFNSYKSKKQFIKDYNSVPIVQNNQRSNKSNYA